MLNNHRTKLFLILTLLFVSSAAAQNKFEGYNLFLSVPESHKQKTCALRYVAPPTEITITDLNPATPMRLANCGSSGARVEQRGANTVMRASDVNYKWCFTGEDKNYQITFKGDEYAGQVTYNWIPESQANGTYNIRDFGAVGDGKTDDTIAFKSAMAFIAAHNGGTLLIPQGDFVVSSPVTVASGVNIQGVSGIVTSAPTGNVVAPSPSRIKWVGRNGSIFRIGECTENVVMKDLNLYTEGKDDNSGIEALGAFYSAQNFYFERVVFQNFNRGLYAHGLPATKFAWQFDYVKFNHCRFVAIRDAGIYTNVSNSDWKIQGSLFINPPRTATDKADSMHFERAGSILIEDTFGGGFQNALGGTFIYILDSGTTTIVSSQTESMTNSLVYYEKPIPGGGDYSYPITIINSTFENPIIFNARRTLVSTGNTYGAKTFKADDRLRVYSTGDRFCYDGWTIGCRGEASSNNFDRATLVFMTGQPSEGMVKGRPTVFGTDVQFGMPVQMPSFLQNVLPADKANGTMVYCSNCRRNSTPCQSGGTGAPAMLVNNQWSCL